MIWEPIFYTTMYKKHRLEIWQGYDGEWRASVSKGANLIGMEGKKTKRNKEEAKKYALKLYKIYKKTRRPGLV